MLPGDLQRLYGNDPGYQNYLNWSAAGSKHPSWTTEGEEAARVLGISRLDPGYEAGLWTSRKTDWGETQDLDQQGNVRSVYNPEWMSFVTGYQGAGAQNAMAQPGAAAAQPPPPSAGAPLPPFVKGPTGPPPGPPQQGPAPAVSSLTPAMQLPDSSLGQYGDPNRRRGVGRLGHMAA